jgi:hypothetical protein
MVIILISAYQVNSIIGVSHWLTSYFNELFKGRKKELNSSWKQKVYKIIQKVNKCVPGNVYRSHKYGCLDKSNMYRLFFTFSHNNE